MVALKSSAYVFTKPFKAGPFYFLPQVFYLTTNLRKYCVCGSCCMENADIAFLIKQAPAFSLLIEILMTYKNPSIALP